MADVSEFSIVTYQRKPGCWRAAFIRKRSARTVVEGNKVRSVVTPDDCAFEADALLAAKNPIKTL